MPEKTNYPASRENTRNAAIATITNIWGQIDWDKVTGSRALGIWDEVSNKVKAAAMTTNSYEKFVDKLCRKLDVRSLRFSDIKEIEEQDENFKQAIMKLFREETLSIMLEVRLNNHVRKEQVQQEKTRQEKERKIEEKLNSTQVSFTDKGVKAYEA